MKAIKQNPSDYYVNVHTSDFPAGALRGQLSRDGQGGDDDDDDGEGNGDDDGEDD